MSRMTGAACHVEDDEDETPSFRTQPHHSECDPIHRLEHEAAVSIVFLWVLSKKYILSYLLPCTKPVWDRLRTGLNRDWFRPVLRPQKTV